METIDINKFLSYDNYFHFSNCAGQPSPLFHVEAWLPLRNGEMLYCVGLNELQRPKGDMGFYHFYFGWFVTYSINRENTRVLA